jgi:hypothetical protein
MAGALSPLTTARMITSASGSRSIAIGTIQTSIAAGSQPCASSHSVLRSDLPRAEFDVAGSEAEGSDAKGSDVEGSDAKGSEGEGSDAEGSAMAGSDGNGILQRTAGTLRNSCSTAGVPISSDPSHSRSPVS